MILIDGSGSMWGGLGSDGVAKIAGVRRALEAALPTLAGRHPIGLATFGPGCRGVDVASPPGVGPLEATLAPLQKFNPRGKGPLVAGLETVAQTFPPGGGGHVILFHDGLDNCGQNACAAAEALHASHPRLAVHTVSLGLEGAELQAMACVARSTGGRSLPVPDHAALDGAVASLAALIRGDGGAAKRIATEPAAAPAAPQGPPRLVAGASLAGKARITSPLVWRVVDAASGTLLHEAVAPSIAVELKPGKVRVEAVSGRIGVTREVEIASAGDTNGDIALEAGIVRFETGARKLANEADEPLIRLDSLAEAIEAGAGTAAATANTASATATTTPAGTPADGKTAAGAVPAAAPPAARGGRERVSTPLWIARGTAAEAILPPGTYRAVAEFGLARAQSVISVTAGNEASVLLALEAGRLELSLAGKAAGAVVYTVAIDDPSHPSGQRIVARSAHPTAAFVLSTGSYAVTAAIDGVETRRVLAVRQGEVTRETFGDDLGRITVSATLNGAAATGAGAPTLAIAPLARGAGANAVAASVDGVRGAAVGRPVAMAPGRYRLTLRLSPGGPSASKDIDVAAGQDQRVGLDLATSEMTITGTSRSSGGKPALCEVRAASGDVVWRGVEAEPRALLAPGRYTLRCTAGPLRRELPVALAAGARVSVAPFAP